LKALAPPEFFFPGKEVRKFNYKITFKLFKPILMIVGLKTNLQMEAYCVQRIHDVPHPRMT
jgi:hypothetical protein